MHAESNALAFELQAKKGETRPVVEGSYVRHPPKSVGGQGPADKTPLSADELERARRIDFLNRWEADDAAPSGPNIVHTGAASVGVARRAICSDCYASGVTLRVPPEACPMCGSRAVLVGPPLHGAERHGAKWPTRASAIAARGVRASGQNLARLSSLPPEPRVEPTGGELSALVELQRARQAHAPYPPSLRRAPVEACTREPNTLDPVLMPHGLCEAHGAPLNAAGHCEPGLRLRAQGAPSAAAPGGAPAPEPGRGAAPLGKIANSVSRANARTDGFQDGGPRPLPWSPDALPSPVPAADCSAKCECGPLRVSGRPTPLCQGCAAFVEWLLARGGDPS